MKRTANRKKVVNYEDDLKNEDSPKYGAELKYEDDNKYENNIKFVDNLQYEGNIKYEDKIRANLRHQKYQIKTAKLTYQTKPTKPNLLNQTYQTEPHIPNQSNKVKAPK